MYARVTTLQLQPGKTDEAVRIVADDIMPVLPEQKGFKGQFFLTQRDTDKAISVNLWETEPDLVAFETSPTFRALMGKIAGILTGPPSTERYEVGIQP